MLRKFDSDDVMAIPISKDIDVNGVPILMNARERADYGRDLKKYKDKDKIA